MSSFLRRSFFFLIIVLTSLEEGFHVSVHLYGRMTFLICFCGLFYNLFMTSGHFLGPNESFPSLHVLIARNIAIIFPPLVFLSGLGSIFVAALCILSNLSVVRGVCLPACLRASVRACVRACVHECACVCKCGQVLSNLPLSKVSFS